MRAPPWAFTLRTCGCSHHPHRVSAHTLSSPRGIGILAPAPRRDQSAGEATHASDPPYMGIVLCSGGVCVRVNVRFVWGAFVSCCFACGCVLELVVCRVRFARVSCPRLRFAPPPYTLSHNTQGTTRHGTIAGSSLSSSLTTSLSAAAPVEGRAGGQPMALRQWVAVAPPPSEYGFFCFRFVFSFI